MAGRTVIQHEVWLGKRLPLRRNKLVFTLLVIILSNYAQKVPFTYLYKSVGDVTKEYSLGLFLKCSRNIHDRYSANSPPSELRKFGAWRGWGRTISGGGILRWRNLRHGEFHFLADKTDKRLVSINTASKWDSPTTDSACMWKSPWANACIISWLQQAYSDLRKVCRMCNLVRSY